MTKMGDYGQNQTIHFSNIKLKFNLLANLTIILSKINFFVKKIIAKVMIQIYHNSRCSKSRQCLALVENSAKNFEVIKSFN